MHQRFRDQIAAADHEAGRTPWNRAVSLPATSSAGRYPRTSPARSA